MPHWRKASPSLGFKGDRSLASAHLARARFSVILEVKVLDCISIKVLKIENGGDR